MKVFFKTLCLSILISGATMAYAGSEVYFSPNGGCQEAVIAQINKAHQSIDIAMYALTSKDISQALLEAKKRRVKIKIILDIFEIKDSYSKSRYLIKKGLDVKFHMGPGLMHDKFAVIDDRVVMTGSYNWTVTADKKNSENLLVMTDKWLARKYAKQFKHLWAHSGEGQLKNMPTADKTE